MEKGSDPFRVSRISLEALAAREADWRALARASLEDNVFLDPAFVLSICALPGEPRPEVWIVEEGADLIGLFPLGPPRPFRRALAHGWQPAHAAFGFPLLRRDRARPAFVAFLEGLAGAPGNSAAFVAHSLPMEGPTHSLLQDVATERELALVEMGRRERPVFATGEIDGLHEGRSLRRARARLASRGTLTLSMTMDTASLAASFAEFLALEAAGWKGRAGTALACADRFGHVRAAFETRLDPARHRLVALRLDGRALAMAFLLRDRDGRDHLWKIAYDEAHARFSPGLLLLADLTRAQAHDGVPLTDSCAQTQTDFIAQLWPQRRALADIAVATRPENGARLAALSQRIAQARKLRAALPHLWGKIRPARARSGG